MQLGSISSITQRSCECQHFQFTCDWKFCGQYTALNKWLTSHTIRQEVTVGKGPQGCWTFLCSVPEYSLFPENTGTCSQELKNSFFPTGKVLRLVSGTCEGLASGVSFLYERWGPGSDVHSFNHTRTASSLQWLVLTRAPGSLRAFYFFFFLWKVDICDIFPCSFIHSFHLFIHSFFHPSIYLFIHLSAYIQQMPLECLWLPQTHADRHEGSKTDTFSNVKLWGMESAFEILL